jgi:hypothetical protein
MKARRWLLFLATLLLVLLVSPSRLAFGGIRSGSGNPDGRGTLDALVHTPSSTSTAFTAAPSLPTATATITPTTTRTTTPTPSPSITPTSDGVYHPAGLVDAPILLYHHISNRGNGSRYAVSPAAFRAQMKILADLGYETVTISELVEVIVTGGYLPEKPLVLTFDDGFLDVYENAFPVLQEYGFKATTYIITGVLETDLAYGYMQPEQLSELSAAGWEIGSHSISHSDLRTTKLGLDVELDQSSVDLETRLGVEVLTFAYPFAAASDGIKEQVKEHGYTGAVGVGTMNRHALKSLYYLSRREVYNTTSLAAFKLLLELPPAPTSIPTITPTSTPEY